MDTYNPPKEASGEVIFRGEYAEVATATRDEKKREIPPVTDADRQLLCATNFEVPTLHNAQSNYAAPTAMKSHAPRYRQ